MEPEALTTDDRTPEDSTEDRVELWRRKLARAHGTFTTLVLPIGIVLLFVGLWTGRPAISLAAQAGMMICGFQILRALYGLAREGGGPRYARAQLLLAVLLTPIAFLGLWAMPILVLSDVDKGVARLREQTMPAAWFVVLDTLVVLLVLGLGVALVGALGLVGLLLAAVAVPVLYKGFRMLTEGARP